MPSKKVKVVWNDKTSRGLNEIYQNTGMCFSFLSSPTDGTRQCHEWVKCRDYLQDAVRTTLTGNPTAIYGFRFDTSNPPVDLKKMRMLVSRYDMNKEADVQTFKRKMGSSLVLLNHFEKHAGIALSKLKEADPDGQKKRKAVFLFIGSAIWMKSPFLVSMYTYLIRLGDKELEFKNAVDLKKRLKEMSEAFSTSSKYSGDNDVDYLRTMWPHLHTVLKNRNKLFVKENGFDETFFKNIGINSFHNNGGILSLIRKNTPNGNLNKRVAKMIG